MKQYDCRVVLIVVCVGLVCWASGTKAQPDLPLRAVLAQAHGSGNASESKSVEAGIFQALTARWKQAAGLALILLVLAWWLIYRPSNDRDWSPEYAETPWAEIKANEVVIHNFRNCDYRSVTDFTVRWETKVVHFRNLRGIDLFMTYWGSRHIAHTLLSFDFGAEGHVCTSIETRRERGETYSALGGLFRQFELYCVIGDERDLIRLRTNYRSAEEVYLYPLVEANPQTYRSLFLAYMRSANDLRSRPRWYHAATNNCTTNIQVIAQASGFASAWDWRILVNGYLDELLYNRGIIASDLPFGETRARAQINARAKRVDGAQDFSARIRAASPYPEPQTTAVISSPPPSEPTVRRT